MNHLFLTQRLCIYSLLTFSFYAHALTPTTFNDGNVIVSWSGMYRPESFLGKNISLLNNCNKFDQLFWARHTLDMGMHIT